MTSEQLDAAYRTLLEASPRSPALGPDMPVVIGAADRRTLEIDDTEYYARWGVWYLKSQGVDLP